ncbi:MAG: ABC transporter substrate-binding protein [Actinomycetes bacterium]
MDKWRRYLVPVALACVAPAGVGCGSSGTSGSGSNMVAATQDLSGKKGGTLKMLWSSDVDYIDPGAAYYQLSYMVDYATQRPLYSWAPDEETTPTPDLADGQPEVSNGGATITVKIRQGINFSPPVNRAVTSADVKYAIERGFSPNVANGYAGAYLGTIKGAEELQFGKAKDISGITTPDQQTIVFNLKQPDGLPKGVTGYATTAVIGALALPLSAPVPPEYAKPFDAKNPSTYGVHQVATGPYMIKNDAEGNTVGYKPTQSLELVRNPNWKASTDYRKAYVDAIQIDQGNDNPSIAAPQILQGQNLIGGDVGPPSALLQQLLKKKSPQLVMAPSGGIRYIALNTTFKPLNDLNVRKAVLAAFDRELLRKVNGGKAIGDIATHFIPPGIPGFDQAGGLDGTGVDFLKNPAGDMSVAASYMKKAGFPSGKYTGSEVLTIVGTSGGRAQKTAEITQNQLQKLGFKTKLQLVTQDSMYTQFCNVPKSQPAVCPNVGWLKDFNDAQTILVPTFNGDNIVPVNNSNWPQLDVQSINEAMGKAQVETSSSSAGDQWAQIDRQITDQAPAIPWVWDNTQNIQSENVKGVINKFNSSWDLSFTSIK